MFKKHEQEASKIKALFYGESATQKTRTAVNGLKNCLVLNLDDGLLSVDDNDDFDSFSVKTAEAFKEAINALTEKCPYDTVVIDTWTIYGSLLEKTMKNQGWSQDSFWMDWTEIVKDNFDMMIAVDANIIFIQHEEWIEDEGKVLRYPSFTGKKFKKYITTKMDIIARFGDSAIEVEGMLGSLMPEKKVLTKNRLAGATGDYKGFGDGENLFKNFQDMINLIGGKNDK